MYVCVCVCVCAIYIHIYIGINEREQLSCYLPYTNYSIYSTDRLNAMPMLCFTLCHDVISNMSALAPSSYDPLVEREKEEEREEEREGNEDRASMKR